MHISFYSNCIHILVFMACYFEYRAGFSYYTASVDQGSSDEEELESAESAERTMLGHDENVEALSYRCM